MVLEMTYPQLERAVNPTHDIRLFSGRSNPKLAQEIADYLGTTVGPMVIKNFADGEIYVQVKESIRGDDVFIVQPLCNPVNENLMELLIMIDAFKRASAKTITAVIPYYGYARQDRKTSGREAITAKLVADLLTTAVANRVLAMDLHTGQKQGFFNILVDHIFATPILVDYVKSLGLNPDEMVAVSPDMGGANRTRHFAKNLDIPMAIIDKRRDRHNEAIAAHIIGDVENKVCLMFDDIIDTAGTICEASKLLKSKGAKEFGIHAFLASNTVTNDYYPMLAKVLFEVAVKLQKETGVHIKFINLSGGVGIPYKPDQEPNDIRAIGDGVRRVYEEVLVPAGMGDVAIYTEMGRFMMGPYGCLVTTAIHEKHTHKEYIGVDACAVNLMRPAMYGAYHHITVMGKEDTPCDHKYDVTGSLCENNDKFAIDRMLPKIDMGDILVIHDTGAHGFSMGYNYNGKLKSAEVLLKEDGSTQLIRRAETPADYFATFDCFDIGKKLIKE